MVTELARRGGKRRARCARRVRWIRARARAEKGEISLEAAQALAEVEDDPRALGNEITKLLTYVNFTRPVELEDVQTLTPAGGEAIIWDMVDAIGQRRGPVAQRELHKLLAGSEPLYILSMIVRQYRLFTLPATELALKHVGRAVPNAALLGGFAAIAGVLKLESVVAAIRQKFPKAIADKNVNAANEAYQMAARTQEPVHA